jgi:hypothetical protein
MLFQMENNWFSPSRVISIYQTFLRLDEDMNGENSLFSDFNMAPVFTADSKSPLSIWGIHQDCSVCMS